MCYKLLDYYKRDINFVFDEEANKTNSIDFFNVKNNNLNKIVYYSVDKIDSYINQYDILPTIGGMLVSDNFIDFFKTINVEKYRVFKAKIKDLKGNINDDFNVLFIDEIVDCIDYERSEIKPLLSYIPNGPKKIIELYFKKGILEKDIARLKGFNGIIIVSQNFVTQSKVFNLKDLHFVTEGNQLTPTII